MKEQAVVKSNEYLVDVRVVVDEKVLHARCSLNEEDIESGKLAEWIKEFKKAVDKR